MAELPGNATQTNYFSSDEVAERYAKVRPFYHDEVMARVCALSGVAKFGRALDVGCGSGQSSVALAEIAGEVVAVDASREMLEQRQARVNVCYRMGVAEELEFGDGEFDLVAVGSALHWFEQRRFYAECLRVLKPEGWLVVYNDHFTAHLEGVVACKRWMRTRFAKRFPPPRRGMRDIDEELAGECGFTVMARAPFSHVVRFTRAEFVAYLLTRSNTLAAIAQGRETQQSVAKWVESETSAFLAEEVSGDFIFKCNLWLLRRALGG